MRQSWVNSKVHTNTGRLCSAGSRVLPVPRRHSSYTALRLPHSLRPRLRSSLAFDLPCGGSLFCATQRRPAACASREHAARRRWITGSPFVRSFTWRNKDLPGYWAILFKRAVVVDPAGCEPLLAHIAETAVAFRLHEALGTQNERRFVAAIPTAHLLAYLRFVRRVTAPAARLGYRHGRAGPLPGGIRTRWMTNRVS